MSDESDRTLTRDGKARRGGSPFKLTKEDVPKVEQALRMNAGLRTAAARALGVARSTLYRFMDEHPEILDTIKDIEEESLDLAEGKVLEAIKGSEMHTVRWYLELKGRARGFSKRVRVEGPNGGPVQAEVTHRFVEAFDGLEQAERDALRGILSKCADAAQDGQR